MRPTLLQTFAVALGFVAGCSSPDAQPINDGLSDSGGLSSGGASSGTTVTSQTSSVSGPTSGSTTTGGVTVGSTTVGSTTAGNTTAGNTTAGNTTGGNTTAGNTTGGNTTAGNTTGGNNTTGGFTTGGNNTTGGATTDGGAGGATSGDPTTSSTTGGSTDEPDCNATMPSGGQAHSGNGQGGSGNLAWQIWSNVGTGNMTTFDVPAFTASWNDSGDYLGRIGFEWGNNGAVYTSHGTITAQFVANKSGSGGGYSYIGMYGWTTNPCVEWYIVDDSYNNMPVNPGNTTNKGEVDIDGGTYIMYTRNTSGTGGSRCSGVSNWIQYYSVRRTARDCGVITLTEHFDAWQSLGMDMSGNLLEAKILVEVGGGQGSVEFPIANVQTTQ